MEVIALKKLRAFVAQFETNEEAARRLKLAPSHLSNILRGTRRAGYPSQIKIYENTAGEITPNEWLIN